MKNFFITILLSVFSISCAQNKENTVNQELKILKKYVNNSFEKNSKEIKTYVVNTKNGKLFLSKTDDLFSEFNFDFENAYEILRKGEKIVYIQKTPISKSGDAAIYYGYFFNEKGRLIGAEKSVSAFYEDDKIVRYKIDYELRSSSDKLERVDEFFSDKDDNKIEKKTKEYKQMVENGEILFYIENLDKINFRDLEGFMKTEKIKYY